MKDFKQVAFKRIDDLKSDMIKGFEANSILLVEVKLTERINDVVKALTRQLADRFETKKGIRIIEKQLKNLFEIVTFLLNC